MLEIEAVEGSCAHTSVTSAVHLTQSGLRPQRAVCIYVICDVCVRVRVPTCFMFHLMNLQTLISLMAAE